MLTYEAFKSLAIAKSLLWQYNEFSDHYDLFALDDKVHYNTTIYKSNTTVVGINPATEATRVLDFETNYKSIANAPLSYRSVDGLVKVADARFVDNLSFYVDGSQGSLLAPAGQTSYVRYNFSYDYTLAGMDLYWYGANWGDYMECEVGFYLNPSDESTFQTISVFSNQYKIYQTGSRLFDVSTVKTIPPSVVINGVTFLIVVRISYMNAGPNDAKAILNLIGWK
jgi:hypothetical protein